VVLSQNKEKDGSVTDQERCLVYLQINIGEMVMADLIANKMRYPVKGILFDKDGTLLDFISLWGSWSESIYHKYSSRILGKIAPLSDLWGTVHDSRGHITDYNRNGPLAMGSIDDLLAILALQGYRVGLTWGEAMRIARESKQLADEELELVRPAYPIQGMIDFLKECQAEGLLLGIVTADNTSEAIKHMDWMGISSYFKVIIGNDQVERGKPFPDMVEKACLQMGLTPNEVAVIGDTNGDMQMGNAAGVAMTIGLVNTNAKSASASFRLLKDASVIVSSYSHIQLEASPSEG
jgi:phosphoglycolate phosphatase